MHPGASTPRTPAFLATVMGTRTPSELTACEAIHSKPWGRASLTMGRLP